MTETVVSTRVKSRRPMICEDEVRYLAAQYGAPLRCTFTIQADEYIRAYRWRKDLDRRAEVVFAIQDPLCRIWLHAKRHYPKHIFRLPSGGINWDEPVMDALHREIAEETGWRVGYLRRIGAYRRFTYMPEYDLWAEKICHVYSGRPTLRRGQPSEQHHLALWAAPEVALELVGNDGERRFLGKLFR